jgi:hypothetical protein
MQQNPLTLPPLAPARMQVSAGTDVNALINPQVYYAPQATQLPQGALATLPLQHAQHTQQALLPVDAVNTVASQLPTTTVGMNVIVQEEIIVTVLLPWEIFAERFDYTFIGKRGELVVAVEPPLFNETTDDWVVTGETVSFGHVGNNQNWRKSLTIRPDSKRNDRAPYEPEVSESQLAVPTQIAPRSAIPPSQWQGMIAAEEHTPVEVPTKPDVVKNGIDTNRMSRSQFKRHSAAMRQKGLDPYGAPL